MTAKASARVLRGGSWNNNGRNCRSANRNRNEPDKRNQNYGFRLAAAPTGTEVPREPAVLPSRPLDGQMIREAPSGGSFSEASRGCFYSGRSNRCCFTVCLAGAGVKAGMTYGQTDAYGYNIADEKG